MVLFRTIRQKMSVSDMNMFGYKEYLLLPDDRNLLHIIGRFWMDSKVKVFMLWRAVLRERVWILQMQKLKYLLSRIRLQILFG